MILSTVMVVQQFALHSISKMWRTLIFLRGYSEAVGAVVVERQAGLWSLLLDFSFSNFVWTNYTFVAELNCYVFFQSVTYILLLLRLLVVVV